MLVFWFGKHTQIRMLSVRILITGIVKKSKGLIILLMFKRIVWVTMALNATHSSALPDFVRCIHAIQRCSYPKLFILCSSFIIVHRIAVKRSGDELIIRWVWQ